MNENRMCLIGEKYTEIINELREYGYEPLPLPINNNLDEEVNCHADMLVFRHGDTLFMCNETADTLNKGLKDYKVHRVEGIGSPYPDDCKLNVTVLGDLLICNKRCASPEIIAYAHENNLRLINTNQGYTKCSLCVVSDNAVITEDAGLSSLLKNYQINVLKIEKGYVHLSDKHYGFIGGAGVKLGQSIMYFNGDLTSHPDYKRIIEFLSRFGIRALFNTNRQLSDFGGFVLI